MLVQALADYADVNLSEELREQEWEEKPVPILIDIGSDGRFLGPIERTYQETRGKKTFTLSHPLPVPKSPVNRNSGLHPLLAADDIKYVLGPGAWTAPKDVANAEERHKAFVRLIRIAAEATQDEALQACERFYDRPDQVQAARDSVQSAKPGTFIALSVDGPVVSRPAVKGFWSDHYRRAFQTRVDAGGTGECLISGRVGPIAPTHEKIKGTSSLGGQASGVSLMSFDKPAFRSYGWEQNANSPLAPDRAMAYVLALNDLLRSEHRRRNIAGIGFIYWTKKPVAFDPMATLDQPAPEQVSKLLEFDPGADPDPNMFFMAGVAGNGARLQVRYWVAESLANIKANLKGWFEGLRVLSLNGQPAPPPARWQISAALEREGADPQSQRVLALIRRAIEGPAQPLGYEMLAAVLNRLRHPAESKADPDKQIYRFTAARLGLVRLCLNDLNQGEKPMTESLDPGQNHPAYLCGRLLAEYENLQDAASGDVNLTIADRYYALASTNPKVAFPKIEGLAKNHFRKLRRDNRGAMVAIERRVIDLHEKIGPEFPPILSLDGQGRFALGYYHQKAERSRQIAENMERKAANNDADNQEQPQ